MPHCVCFCVLVLEDPEELCAPESPRLLQQPGGRAHPQHQEAAAVQRLQQKSALILSKLLSAFLLQFNIHLALCLAVHVFAAIDLLDGAAQTCGLDAAFSGPLAFATVCALFWALPLWAWGPSTATAPGGGGGGGGGTH